MIRRGLLSSFMYVVYSRVETSLTVECVSRDYERMPDRAACVTRGHDDYFFIVTDGNSRE